MALSDKDKMILLDLTLAQIEALDHARVELTLQSAPLSRKKDSEFDTVWALAKEEGRVQGMLDLISYVRNLK